MRRAQSVRHYGRPSLAQAQGTDDLGVLTENEESPEDTLRRQLLEKDRENDKLKMQVQSLQDQLAQRPPLETIQELEKEYKNLELLLQGTNRENERAMMELERGKAREKMLERELAKLAGENWQSALDIAPSVPLGSRTSSFLQPHRAATAPDTTPSVDAPSVEATMAHVEQVRLLILGMEQRLQTREEKLTKAVEHADAEGKRFDAMRKEVISAGV